MTLPAAETPASLTYKGSVRKRGFSRQASGAEKEAGGRAECPKVTADNSILIFDLTCIYQ